MVVNLDDIGGANYPGMPVNSTHEAHKPSLNEEDLRMMDVFFKLRRGRADPVSPKLRRNYHISHTDKLRTRVNLPNTKPLDPSSRQHP